MLALGPEAPAATADKTQLLCGTSEGHSLCPAAARATSGVFYTERCLGYLDPTADMSWNESTDAAQLQRFGYGEPPRCRPCPPGCRCPGGNRCRTLAGYFLEGEELLPADDPNAAPELCHTDARIAKERCGAWSITAAATVCLAGTVGERCEECDASFFRAESATCAPCEEPTVSFVGGAVIAGSFCAIFVVAFALVAVVQSAYGRDVGSGALRSLRFAGWIISALATQAQIGRMASANQPALLLRWYRLLKLFEFNPEAVQPGACADRAPSTIAITAMSIGLACAVLVMLLALPCAARSAVRATELAISPCMRAAATMKEKKQAKQAAKKEAKAAEVEGEGGAAARVNPLVGQATGGGIEMTAFGERDAGGGGEEGADGDAARVSVFFTVTFCTNPADNLTCSPSYIFN